MFRARFTEAFPKSLPNFGPQELERDVVETIPGERVEQFLCALLGLLLNRKQDVKYVCASVETPWKPKIWSSADSTVVVRPGHYNRALEEAIQTHKGQWAKDWESQNPLSGGATFGSMTPVQRVCARHFCGRRRFIWLRLGPERCANEWILQLTLLHTLVQWALSSSDVIKTMINQAYKNRHDDDLNIAFSIQPWGSDGDKRRYFLIEGNDDTTFRVYRESNPAGVNRTWWSVAGSIDELKALCEKLETNDGGPKARALAKKMAASIPRFEATEEKRRRREYRQMRKEQFKRPETGLSLYEGRTRGKRMKYTYSEDEDDFYSDSTNRRSTRNTRNHTPAEPSGPVTTASGRQIRAPTRLNETASNGAPSAPASVQGDEANHEESVGPTGRPRRSAAANHSRNGWATRKRKSQEYDSEEDEDSEPDFGDDEEDEHVPDLDDEEEEEEEFDDDVLMDEVDELGGRVDERFMFTFPIRVTFDENNKVKRLPGPPPGPADKHKHPRTAHRNVVMSEESDSGETTDVQAEPEVVMEPEGPAAEVIAVATKQLAPTSQPVLSNAPTMAEVTTGTQVKPALNPANGAPTSLAFRGSPEKPQAAPMPIDVGFE